MNYTMDGFQGTSFARRGNGFRFRRNDYFYNMISLGYNISAYQSDYIDYCGDRRVMEIKCRTYRFQSIEYLQDHPFSVGEKIWVLASMYLNRSNLQGEIRKFYGKSRTI